MSTLEVKMAEKGNSEITTCHDGQRIVLVHVRETGELCMGGMFRTGGFGTEWVPQLVDALELGVKMASEIGRQAK